jgi:UPF0176 protein
MDQLVVAALYHFCPVSDIQQLRGQIKDRCQEWGIMGTLILAEEGINGTVAGHRQEMDALLAFLRKDGRFPGLEHKESYLPGDSKPFLRLKIKIKKEIVTLGLPEVDPTKEVGTYLDAEEWNRVIQDPEVLLIDGRNDYEYALGHFQGTIDTGVKTFREFPAWAKDNLDPKRHKKIAMFCTGGIRCEKASSLLLSQGFEEVFHLKGGVLKYFEEMSKQRSLWEGECYVFDNRVTVNQDLAPGSYAVCHGCREPISDTDQSSERFIRGVCCPNCYDKLSPRQVRRFSERQKQIDLAKARGTQHIGMGQERSKKHSEQAS